MGKIELSRAEIEEEIIIERICDFYFNNEQSSAHSEDLPRDLLTAGYPDMIDGIP